MLVGVHAQRWRLDIIGHVGEADARIGRALDRTTIGRGVCRKDFIVLHRAADPDGIGMTGR